MSEETKEKHRIRGKKRYPIEMIEAVRTNHYLKGKHRSPETIEKMRIASTGRKHSPEDRKKQSLAQKGKVRTCKIFTKSLKSPDGVVYKNMTNLAEFARKHGLDRRRMSEFLSGKRNQWGGWTIVGGAI